MKAADDKKTPDLLGDTCDLAGERPQKPKARTTKQRLADYMNRHEVRAVTVFLPADLVAEFDARVRKNGHVKKDVIAKLIRSQYLRKR